MIVQPCRDSVFCDSGVGGVHRGYEETMDASADLEELAQSDVTVICAGAKSILDIPRTLEYLETKGVTVIGYQCDTLPEFFTREGSCKLQQRMDTVEEIADMLHVKKSLGLKGGVLVANPIPEAYSMDAAYMNAVIEEAVQNAKAAHIQGKYTTPYLLSQIVKATEGKALRQTYSSYITMQGLERHWLWHMLKRDKMIRL